MTEETLSIIKVRDILIVTMPADPDDTTINDLLDLSRINRIALRKESISLTELGRGVVADSRTESLRARLLSKSPTDLPWWPHLGHRGHQ